MPSWYESTYDRPRVEHNSPYSLPDGISLQPLGRAPPSYGEVKFEERRERQVNEWKTKTMELLDQIANRMASSPWLAGAAAAVREDGTRFITQSAEAAKTMPNDDDLRNYLMNADAQLNKGVSGIPSGGRQRKTKKSKRRPRKTRRARK